MDDWDDLRYLLAVVDHGSTLRAAGKLGVNQSTVHRRIDALERRIGRAVVERTPAGYRLNRFGEALLPALRAVAEAMAGFEWQVQAEGDTRAGVIRLTCPEPLVPRLTDSDLLARFHHRHPGLRVELVMSDHYLDLAKGEADVALRSGEAVDEALFGRKIGESVWAVYASQNYVQAHGGLESVAAMTAHPVIGFEGLMQDHRAARWLRVVAPTARIVAQSASVLGVLQAVKSGVGIAPLPTTIAGMHPDLVQLLPPVADLSRGWYLLTPIKLREVPRIRAFLDFVVDHLDLVRPILMG